MRKIVMMLFGLPLLFNRSRDVVVSTAYSKRDGRAAFILDLNKSDGAFELRAVRSEGPESDALAEIAVAHVPTDNCSGMARTRQCLALTLRKFDIR